MAQLGVHCSRGRMPWDECKRCRLQPLHPCHLTPDLLQLMERRPTTRNVGSSPSRLTGCDRQTVLMAGGDHYEDVHAAWPLVRGTMIHAILENSGRVEGYDGTMRETRLTTTLDVDGTAEEVEQGFDPTRTDWEPGQEIFSGQPDLLLVDTTTTDDGWHARVKIVDYKSTEITHTLLSAYPEHVMQINMYAWLARRCLPELMGWDSVEVSELEILYLSQKKTRRFTSAGPLTDRGKLVDRRAGTYETVTLAPIPLLTGEVTEEWITRRIRERKQAQTVLPPILTGDRAKLCYGCPVKERCYQTGNVEAERG